MEDGDPNLSQVPGEEGLGLGLAGLIGDMVLKLRSGAGDPN